MVIDVLNYGLLTSWKKNSPTIPQEFMCVTINIILRFHRWQRKPLNSRIAKTSYAKYVVQIFEYQFDGLIAPRLVNAHAQYPCLDWFDTRKAHFKERSKIGRAVSVHRLIDVNEAKLRMSETNGFLTSHYIFGSTKQPTHATKGTNFFVYLLNLLS